jgi:phosphatidylserine decarboxylase
VVIEMDEKKFVTFDMSYKENLFVSFLYKTLPGRMVLCVLIRPVISKFLGAIMDSGISRFLVPSFIKNNNICLDDYPDTKYKSFNDFFTREVKNDCRPISANTDDLIAPCDGKLTAYQITSDSVFWIKKSAYSISCLLQDEQLSQDFNDGVCLIFRLMPDDYHRYCYIDDGEIVSWKKIKGVLHTVRPIALEHHNIYVQNSREYDVLQSKNFGKIVQLEVGALFVGRIVNRRAAETYARGEEKGMFEFGGSTIVMLFQKDAVTIDECIYENTRHNKETIVKQGYKIGEKMI